jgi:hypothetical protein
MAGIGEPMVPNFSGLANIDPKGYWEIIQNGEGFADWRHFFFTFSSLSLTIFNRFDERPHFGKLGYNFIKTLLLEFDIFQDGGRVLND